MKNRKKGTEYWFKEEKIDDIERSNIPRIKDIKCSSCHKWIYLEEPCFFTKTFARCFADYLFEKADLNVNKAGLNKEDLTEAYGKYFGFYLCYDCIKVKFDTKQLKDLMGDYENSELKKKLDIVRNLEHDKR